MHGLTARRTNRKLVSVVKSYMQPPTVDTVSLSVNLGYTVGQSRCLGSAHK